MTAALHPTALLAFLPLCEDETCARPILGPRISDFCALHSGCDATTGDHPFTYTCGNEVVEILSESSGRCESHRTTNCISGGCENEAIDPGASDDYADYCYVCKDEAQYEAACENGYTGPRYRY